MYLKKKREKKTTQAGKREGEGNNTKQWLFSLFVFCCCVCSTLEHRGVVYVRIYIYLYIYIYIYIYVCVCIIKKKRKKKTALKSNDLQQHFIYITQSKCVDCAPPTKRKIIK